MSVLSRPGVGAFARGPKNLVKELFLIREIPILLAIFGARRVANLSKTSEECEGKNGGTVWGEMGGVICKPPKSLAVPTGFEPVSPP